MILASLAHGAGVLHALSTSTVTVQGGVTAYVVLFLLMAISGATIPALGTVVVGAAAVLASKNELDIDVVVVVACLGALTGGIIGYWVGVRWGAGLMERPGWREEERKKSLENGRRLYAKWGWAAVFVIPSVVAGIAAMRFIVFVAFYAIAVLVYQLATVIPAYAAGSMASGDTSTINTTKLIGGLVVLGAIYYLYRRMREHRAAAE
jgi:membrane protein DedA with SNARE-associated domain